MRRLSILIAVTLAGLTSAAQQPPSQRVERDDPASPRDSVTRLEDPASWRRVGIDPGEARRWIDAGIPFAEWANQWKGEGFGPVDAGVWAANRVNVYTAGDFRTAGFSVWESTAWIEHGVRSAQRAKEFRDRAFSPSEAGEWWIDFYPEEAAEWRAAGFTPHEALTWRYGEKQFFYSRDGFRGYSRDVHTVRWATEWRSAGFSHEQARLAGWYGLKFDEAKEWLREGFDFDATMAWKDSGFKPADAARERAGGLGPVEAEQRRLAASSTGPETTATLHADIALKTDSTVDVTETLAVTQGSSAAAEPCLSRRFDSNVRLWRSLSSFNSGWPSHTITSVVRNGVAAGHTTEKDWYGNVTVCVREPAAPAAGETRTFTMRYTTDDRVIALRDRDRFYFDVKGTIPMTLRQASATVHLPKGGNTVRVDGFAGPERRRYITTQLKETAEGDVIEYAATRPLTRDMEFKVAVEVPKGIVQPGPWRRLRRFDREIGRVLSSLSFVGAGWVLALAYFIWAWWRVGRDPQKGAVVSVYEPPGGASPALVRYVAVKRRVDDVTAAATLVRLAHSGAVRIVESEGRYTIEKTGRAADDCASHESEFLDALCADTSTLVLGTVQARMRMRTARRGLQNTLRSAAAAYFAANTRYVWPGAIVSVAGAMLGLAVVDWSEMRNDYAYPLFVAGLQAVLIVPFRWLIKAPTARGRKFRDDIEGFRRVLEANFQGTRGTLATAPGGAPPALAMHLPYAIALGINVERATILDRRASWFTGRSGGFSGSDFTASLRSLKPRAALP